MEKFVDRNWETNNTNEETLQKPTHSILEKRGQESSDFHSREGKRLMMDKIKGKSLLSRESLDTWAWKMCFLPSHYLFSHRYSYNACLQCERSLQSGLLVVLFLFIYLFSLDLQRKKRKSLRGKGWAWINAFNAKIHCILHKIVSNFVEFKTVGVKTYKRLEL